MESHHQANKTGCQDSVFQLSASLLRLGLTQNHQTQLFCYSVSPLSLSGRGGGPTVASASGDKIIGPQASE